MTEFELKHGLSQDEPGPLEPVEIAAAGVSTEEAQPPIDWAAVSARIAGYAEEYELRGEDDHGREGVYTPNETERGLIIDAIHGLLADDEFMALMRRPALAAGDALDALRELVECDNIKKRIASMQVCILETDDDVQELDAMMSDLARRQPAAWDAARAALAAQRKGDA